MSTPAGPDLGSAPSKTGRAYAWIKERVASHELPPGSRIVLGAVADELGMSAVPVREALRQLEAEGVVTFEHNVGARVSSVDESQYRAAMQAIAVVESAATALAAPRLTPADLRRAREVNAAMRDLAAAPDRFDPREFSRLNQEFHRLLYARCPNPRLLEMVDAEWARLGHLRDTIFAFVPGRAEQSVREHEQIVTLVEGGVPVADVERAVRRHRRGTLAAYLEHEHPDRRPDDPADAPDAWL